MSSAQVGLLDPDATAVADGGGLASAALHPVQGGDLAGRTAGNLRLLERGSTASP